MFEHTLEIELHNTQAPVEHIIESCGVLPEWFSMILEATDDDTTDMIIRKLYPFYVDTPMGGVVDRETGVYKYPEDPPQLPLMKLTNLNTGRVAYFYQHAVVAFEKCDGTFHTTRMD